MFFKRPLLKEIFILSIIIAFLHKVALTFYFYWTISWFDIVMHFLGGLLMGLIALFIFITLKFIYISNNISDNNSSSDSNNNFNHNNEAYLFRNKLNAFIITFGFVLIIGLAWELWELFSGLTNALEDKVDTIIDLIIDMIGAGVALWYFFIKKSLINKTSDIQEIQKTQ